MTPCKFYRGYRGGEDRGGSSEGKENGCEEHGGQRDEKVKVKLVGERLKRLEERLVV